MDYIPPPPLNRIELFIPAAHKTQNREERLTIFIDEAGYNVDEKLATIKMSKAFQKSSTIQNHHGDDIILIYKNSFVDFKDCPPVRVPIINIKRDIHFLENTVTLTISNIPVDLAEKIHDAMCLLIDTETVKKVSNPSYPPAGSIDLKKPYSHLNR